MYNVMRVFLTGHNGFVGAHLLPKLIELGIEVETDMRYLHTRKYFAVIHLAAETHTRTEFDPELIESNFILTNEIFKVPTTIIYASSCSARYDTNPYAQSKIYAEHLAEIHGNAVGLRFFNIYGPGNNKGLIWYLMNREQGEAITIRGPELIRDYIHVDDVIREILFHLGTGFIICGVRDVGTGIGTSTLQLLNLFSQVSGKIFKVQCAEAGAHEPPCMVASVAMANTITLKQGLQSLVNESQEYQIH